MTAGLVLALSGGGAALAAADDRSEAEGLFLSGGGLVNLDSIAALAGPYEDFPPGGATSSPIDLTALSLINLGLGVELFGGNDVLTLGAVGQYASADAGGAFASSGLIGSDGAIQVGAGAPGENTTLNLGPVLSDLGLEEVIETLSLELGAVSASAEMTRGDTVTLASDYQIASGELILTSPVLADVAATLDTTLTTSSTAVNALAADGGPIDTAVNGLLDGIEDILDSLLLGAVGLDDPSVTTTLAVDLGAALDAVSDDEFVSGPISITLGTGQIVIDLDELYALNNMAPNTTLLSDAGLNPTIAEALSDILTVQLPAALETAITNVLNTTSLDITINAGVSVIVPIGTLAIGIDGTVGGFLGTAGSTPPTTSLAGTEIAGLPVGDLLEPITDYVVASILPAVGTLVDDALDLEALEASLTATLTGAITALQPVLATVNQVVTITVNVQENPGEFRDPNGLDAGSFTQRAVSLVVAPGVPGGAIALDLASATVRAVPLAAPADLTMTPVRGPVTGGTEVTISGENLTDVTEILFGSVPVGSFTVEPDGDIVTTTPPQAEPGPVTVTVTNPDGSNTTLSFEYFNVTQVTTIEPDSGTTAGGDVITITGECFTGATEVLFDGVPGTAFTVVSDTEIEVTTPAGAAGPVDVTIVNPTECGDATVPDGFTYVAPGAPVLTALDPDRGPETGGTPVTITGDDFTGTTSVTFDGVEAAFEVISDTEIQATTPAHAPGVVDVIVTNGTGASAPLDFEYYNIADITGVTPDSGPEAGGNTVTITGDCFTGATGVLFGGTAASSFTVVSDTQITAVVPAGAGTVDVTVLGAGECGTAVAEDAYEYIEAPVVTDLDPTSGPETGGTVVTITGEGFTGATGVDFGDEPGTSFTVVSDTEIQVTSPPGVPGVVPVTVLHPGGNVDAGDFEFLNVPTVTGIDPTQGPEDGGTVVTITGEGFTGATAVTFDGIDGTDFTVVSDTEIQVTTPPHAPATVPVIVEHPVADADAGEFTYLAGTEIDSVDPPAGPEAGGNTVTITGVCFTGATGVLFGDTPATSFTVISDTQITAVVPAGTGTVDVTVTGSPTCGTDTLPDAYEYTNEPVIGSLAPSSGPETGGTVVTITGVNFTGVTSVTFDGVAGTGLTVVSDTELTVTTPPGTPGPAVVVVTSPDGASDPGTFEYLPVTDVDGTDPGTGPTGGGTVVTITGQCFTGATAVLFGGVASPDFEVVNDTTIRAVTPAAARPGAVDVTVVGAGTCGTGVLEGGFTYVAGPAGGGSLPATGATVDAAPWTLFGALLLLAGAMAVIWRRRMA